MRNELTSDEYKRLVRAAMNTQNERLALIIQAICSTRICISELQCITVEAVRTGRSAVSCKGKIRIIFLPDKLRVVLRKYIHKQKITAGVVLVKRNGKPVDRSNIWRDMKTL